MVHRHYFVAIDAAETGHRLPTFDQQLADAVDLVDGRSRTGDRDGQTGWVFQRDPSHVRRLVRSAFADRS
jgi:hypothetical protein